MAVAGFSVGEITAAIFTGAVSLGEGINLVKIRGEAMQAASDLEESGMMTGRYSLLIGRIKQILFSDWLTQSTSHL